MKLLGLDITWAAAWWYDPLDHTALVRRGFSDEVIHVLRRCYKIVYRQGLTVEDALKELDELAAKHPEVDLFRQSIVNSARGITR